MHVGTGKTGTSSVQAFLRVNRERLAELGVLYPRTPGRARHQRLGLFLKPDAELVQSPEWHDELARPGSPPGLDPAGFRRSFRRRFLREVEQSGLSRVLLSDEIIFGSPDPVLRRLRRFTDRIAGHLRVVAYLRRQDDHMVSRYQQGVKIGWVLRLREWADEDMSALYDYHARLCRHRELLAPDDLVVRRFEPDGFVDGSIFQDFLAAAGIGARVTDLEQVPDRNLSLDAETVEFLRLVNLYRVEHEGATPGLIDNRQLVWRLAEASTGPVLTLPNPILDRFMERWEEPNRRVARDFFGDRDDRLFRVPRKTRNTTTEQRLDPARIDGLLSLAELPEQMHGPLRALAEREARGH